MTARISLSIFINFLTLLIDSVAKLLNNIIFFEARGFWDLIQALRLFYSNLLGAAC